jgi:hypothetical protein
MKQFNGILSCIILFFIVLSPSVESKEKKAYLAHEYRKLRKTLGDKNTDKAKITKGPEVFAMPRGKTAGKIWHISLGKSKFKISIEDKAKLDIKEAIKRIEKVPPMYRRCFEIVSEDKKAGVAFYLTIGGAAAHGGQQYLNIVHKAGSAVMIHEAGHILEQRAGNTDKEILEKWKLAIAQDKISISRYGDQVAHEDLAEFAMVYALCLDGGKDYLIKLKKKSPKRYELWVQILKLSKSI